MIALNFDALGGNNYSHLDTSSFCLYIDRRDNETHPSLVAERTDPITTPLSEFLSLQIPLYIPVQPPILLSLRSISPQHLIFDFLVDSISRGELSKFFLNFQKGGGEFFPPSFA